MDAETEQLAREASEATIAHPEWNELDIAEHLIAEGWDGDIVRAHSKIIMDAMLLTRSEQSRRDLNASLDAQIGPRE